MSFAVILDMDGLMFDTEAVSRRVWRLAAADLGLDFPDEVADAMVGRPEAATRDMLRGRYGEVAPAFVSRAQARYRAALESEGVPKKPGLDDLLDWLVRERIPRAVATSTARALTEFKLVRAGIRSVFDVVVCGDEVAHGKPSPDIFLRAASELGHEPGMCIVLEDSGPGILAADAAGMMPVLVPDGVEPSDAIRAKAHAVVASLDEARHLLEALRRERRPASPSK